MKLWTTGGCSQEGLKQASMQHVALKQEFRVPLQAQEESVRRDVQSPRRFHRGPLRWR